MYIYIQYMLGIINRSVLRQDIGEEQPEVSSFQLTSHVQYLENSKRNPEGLMSYFLQLIAFPS